MISPYFRKNEGTTLHLHRSSTCLIAKNSSLSATKDNKSISVDEKKLSSGKTTISVREKNHHKSSFFVNSPISCSGSILKKDKTKKRNIDFLSALLNNKDNEFDDNQCERVLLSTKINEKKKKEACAICAPHIQNGIQHFQMCHIFCERWENFLNNNNKKNSNSCLEYANYAIQQSCRHLCLYGCYLRAFAPFREWVMLRNEVHKMTDVSVGEWK